MAKSAGEGKISLMHKKFPVWTKMAKRSCQFVCEGKTAWKATGGAKKKKNNNPHFVKMPTYGRTRPQSATEQDNCHIWK